LAQISVQINSLIPTFGQFVQLRARAHVPPSWVDRSAGREISAQGEGVAESVAVRAEIDADNAKEMHAKKVQFH
jgi:hypothetical protein